MTIYVCTATHSMHDDVDPLVAAGATRSAAEKDMDRLLNEQTDADFWIVNQAVEVEVVADQSDTEAFSILRHNDETDLDDYVETVVSTAAAHVRVEQLNASTGKAHIAEPVMES